MKRLEVPEFATYEDEAAFWDSLDTGDLMEDDGKWFRFETPTKRAVRIAVLPDIAEALAQRAHAQGVQMRHPMLLLRLLHANHPPAAIDL
jgi:hypothetical protein